MSEPGKPTARLLREAKFYRDIAAKAVRLRRIGQIADDCEEQLQKLWDENPHITRSLTMPMMYHQAFKTAMSALDEAVLQAALAGVTFDEIELPTAILARAGDAEKEG